MWEKISLALFGVAIGWLLQQYRIARSEDVALVNEHIKDLEKFCDASVAYWLKTFESHDEDLASAAKIKAAQTATTLLYDEIGKICQRTKPAYRRMSIDLFTAATGGDFEGKGRKYDAARAIEVYEICSNLIHFLRLTRKDVLSLNRMWRTYYHRLF